MNAELQIDLLPPTLESRQSRFIKVALGLSLLLHFLGLLTSPYWQPAPAQLDQVMEVDIASVPIREMPPVPSAPIRMPAPVPPPPRRVEAAPMTEPAPAAPEVADASKPAPTKEEIRQNIRTSLEQKKVGLLGALDKAKVGEKPSAGDPLGIQVREGSVSSGRASSRAGDFAPAGGGGAGLARGGTPTITKEQMAALKAGKGAVKLASLTFREDAAGRAVADSDAGGAIDDSTRSAQAINGTIKTYQSGIKMLYNRELTTTGKNLSGKVTVSFVIQPDGSVDSVDVVQTTMNWPPFEEALKKRIRRWTFGPAAKAGPVKVAFPFVFNPEM